MINIPLEELAKIRDPKIISLIANHMPDNGEYISDFVHSIKDIDTNREKNMELIELSLSNHSNKPGCSEMINCLNELDLEDDAVYELSEIILSDEYVSQWSNYKLIRTIQILTQLQKNKQATDYLPEIIDIIKEKSSNILAITFLSNDKTKIHKDSKLRAGIKDFFSMSSYIFYLFKEFNNNIFNLDFLKDFVDSFYVKNLLKENPKPEQEFTHHSNTEPNTFHHILGEILDLNEEVGNYVLEQPKGILQPILFRRDKLELIKDFCNKIKSELDEDLERIHYEMYEIHESTGFSIAQVGASSISSFQNLRQRYDKKSEKLIKIIGSVFEQVPKMWIYPLAETLYGADMEHNQIIELTKRLSEKDLTTSLKFLNACNKMTDYLSLVLKRKDKGQWDVMDRTFILSQIKDWFNNYYDVIDGILDKQSSSDNITDDGTFYNLLDLSEEPIYMKYFDENFRKLHEIFSTINHPVCRHLITNTKRALPAHDPNLWVFNSNPDTQNNAIKYGYCKKEEDALDENLDDILNREDFDNSKKFNLIDLGCGNGKKTLKVIEKIIEKGYQNINICLIDCNAGQLKEAEATISEYCDEKGIEEDTMKITTIKSKIEDLDENNEYKEYMKYTNENTLHTFLGTTYCNFDFRKINEDLKKVIKKYCLIGAYIYDKRCTNLDKLVSCYSTNKMMELSYNHLTSIDPNINTDNLEFWYDESNVPIKIMNPKTTKKEFDDKFGRLKRIITYFEVLGPFNLKKIPLNQGDLLPAIISQKPTKKQMKIILKRKDFNGEFKIINDQPYTNKDVALYLIEKPQSADN